MNGNVSETSIVTSRSAVCRAIAEVAHSPLALNVTPACLPILLRRQTDRGKATFVGCACDLSAYQSEIMWNIK